MRTRKVSLIFRKDWREIRRNWQVLLPIIVIPFIASVLLPLIITVIPTLTSTASSSLEGFEALIKNLPTSVQYEIAGMRPEQAVFYLLTLYFFAPIFLIIPIMASSVIASDSFAGEKERKTIEALLATPVSDSELFLGKVLVSFIPSMIVTFASFLTYSAVVDLFSYTMLNGRLLLPNMLWVLLVFGVAPTVALASIGLTVIVSGKVKGFREAQQISVILLLPILGLVFGQVSGAIILGPLITALLIAIFALVDLIVFYAGVKTFGREEILSKPA
jgi:ABC-2 type transport system permease protein